MTLSPLVRRGALAFACAALLAGSLAGCATDPSTDPTWAQARKDPLIDAASAAADALASQLAARQDVRVANPVVVASLQNLSALDKPAPLGRLLGESIGARLTQLGYPVVEARLANSLTINPDGEMLLSDQARDIAQAHKAQVVVVGSWTAGGRFVYVTVKALRADNGLTLATQTFALPRDPNVAALLTAPKSRISSGSAFAAY
jgi:TolB-like protein